jgi:predicted SAM-dependent methyltransferase
MKLELGCGRFPSAGYVHHDIWAHSPHIDLTFDLDKTPWPIATGSVEDLLALDVFEHLKIDIREWLDECYRILRPDGTLTMRLPAWDNPLSYRDPTHRKVYHEETFLYWCPSNPGQIWQEFGQYYFGLGYTKWWKQVSVVRQHNDLRFTMKKDVTA